MRGFVFCWAIDVFISIIILLYMGLVNARLECLEYTDHCSFPFVKYSQLLFFSACVILLIRAILAILIRLFSKSATAP